MEFSFHFDRSLQAAAYLLQREDGGMEYLRLLKLLYIAERELLAHQATPLTGDVFKAMPYGPVLDTVYDLIKGKHGRSAEWQRSIQTKHYKVQWVGDPGTDELSPCVIAKLDEVSQRYQDVDHWMLVNETHQFAEWRKHFPGRGAAIIPLEDLLWAMNAEEGTLEAIREEQAVGGQLDQILAASRDALGADTPGTS